MALRRATVSQRLATLYSMAVLVIARIVVSVLPLKMFRSSLGEMQSGPGRADTKVAGNIKQARFWAVRVERASMRLPGESKCLPKAIALQWQLQQSGIGSHLVISIHRTERQATHAYHSWVETGGEILIGQCDRSEYQPVMTFQSEPR